jgi:hypothetical protein
MTLTNIPGEPAKLPPPPPYRTDATGNPMFDGSTPSTRAFVAKSLATCIECGGKFICKCPACSQGKVKKGFAAIMGKWPGDETDEQIEQALKDLS